MFARLAYSWSLRKLRRTKQRITRAYDADIAAAHRAKDYEKVTSLREAQHWEERNCGDDIARLETDYYRDVADKLGVPLPPFVIDENGDGEDWYRPQMFGRAVLTRLGRAKLRSDIRKEKRERRDAWLPYLSALTALFAVVVAGLAIIYKR